MGREESSQERLTVDLSGRAPAIVLGGPTQMSRSVFQPVTSLG